MSGGKEIRTKIKSIQNTQKITKAMETIARMRKKCAVLLGTPPRPMSSISTPI